MIHKKIITHSPVRREEENGTIVEGHSYSITMIWDGDYHLETYVDWTIFKDGTWEYAWDEGIACDYKMGTFDVSRYDEFVEQMENLKTEWIEELEEYVK